MSLSLKFLNASTDVTLLNHSREWLNAGRNRVDMPCYNAISFDLYLRDRVWVYTVEAVRSTTSDAVYNYVHSEKNGSIFY